MSDSCCSGRIALKVGLSWALVIGSLATLLSSGVSAAVKCINSDYIDCVQYQQADDQEAYEQHKCFKVQSDFLQCVIHSQKNVDIAAWVSLVLLVLAAACFVSIGFSQSKPDTAAPTRAGRWATWAKIAATLGLFVLGLVCIGASGAAVQDCVTPEYQDCLEDELKGDGAAFKKEGCFEILYEAGKCIQRHSSAATATVLSGYLWLLLSIIVSCTLCCCQPRAQQAVAPHQYSPVPVAPEAAARQTAERSDVTQPLVAHKK